MNRNPSMTTLHGFPAFIGPFPPANQKLGWLWRDTDTDVTFRWDGSAWVPYSETGLPIVGDPTIAKGASFWDLSPTPTLPACVYVVGAGTNGTDVIEMTPPASPNRIDFLAAERRGPHVFDLQAITGMSLVITWRARLTDAGSGAWTQDILARVWITDEEGSGVTKEIFAQGHQNKNYSNADPLNVWHTESAVITIPDEGLNVRRYIQIGLTIGGTEAAVQPTFQVDLLNALISSPKFAGADKPGLMFGTISTADPTGTPADGELWIKVEP